MEAQMKQILRRLLTLAVTLLLISFLIFVIFQIIPGDGAVLRLGTDATPEQIAEVYAKSLPEPLQKYLL